MSITDKRIIYPKNDGVAIVIPSPNWPLSIEDLAQKDVPEGVPYRIVDVEAVPSDRTFRDAWEADFDKPDGKAIGHVKWEKENLTRLQEAIMTIKPAPKAAIAKKQKNVPSVIKFNMEKARNIKRDMLRKERGALLEDLDITFIRAVEIGDIAKQESVALEKQRLRDAPAHPLIDQAETPDELKAIRLEDLI